MAVLLDRPTRWSRVRQHIQQTHGITVNFSGHGGYYSAYNYVKKEDRHVLYSDSHPDVVVKPKTYAATNVKEAEDLGYSVDHVQLASNFEQMPTSNILSWLRETSPQLKHIVVKCFSERNLGVLSLEEACEALTACDCDIQRAVGLCAQERQAKVDQLAENENNFEKDDIIDALSNSKGDVKKALLELERKALKQISYDILNEKPKSLQMFYSKLQNKEFDKDERIRLTLAHFGMKSWGRASTAVSLMELKDNDGLVEDCVEAATNNEGLERAKRFMNHECTVCYARFSTSKLFTHMYCQCEICYECVALNIAVVVKEKSIRELVCPGCSKPDFSDEGVDPMQHFQLIGHEIEVLKDKGLLDVNIKEMFEEKLRDFNLKNDPNFRWCAHCPEFGFVWEEPGQNKMFCTKCQKNTCFSCKQKWEVQHEGLTCEEFKQCKIDNDPENQLHGLEAHLTKNGITCPKCNTRFDLAHGGCIHFTCSNCKYQFCGECFQEFLSGACKDHPGKGLHAHHPRNCFYYQRDMSIDMLQKLLILNTIEFNKEAPAGQDEHICYIMEQKEGNGGKFDEKCGKETTQGCAGLCNKHYNEYLIKVINKNGIDPLDIMDQNSVEILIKRHLLEVPEKDKKETDDAYLKRLHEFVKEQLPLPRLAQDGNMIPPRQPQPQPEQIANENNIVINDNYQNLRYWVIN
eukprot:gene18723-20612_t